MVELRCGNTLGIHKPHFAMDKLSEWYSNDK